jgi:hypothetical protein
VKDGGRWRFVFSAAPRGNANWGDEKVDQVAEWAHERDGVLEVKKAPRVARVIPYDEVARRLQERKKKK